MYYVRCHSHTNKCDFFACVVHTASNQNRRRGRPGNEAMYMLQTWVLFFKCKIAFEMHGCNTKIEFEAIY